MKVSEILKELEIWYKVNFSDGNRFKGAYISGSLSSKPLSEEFPYQSSDIDFIVITDPENEPSKPRRYPDGKYYYLDGCLIQVNYLPYPKLEEKDFYLSSTSIASNLRHGRVIADLEGRLEKPIEILRQEFHQPRWTKERLSISEKRIKEQLIPGYLNATSLVERSRKLTKLNMFIAGLVPIALNRTPTHRKALVLLEEIFKEHDRVDLFSSMIDLLGISDISSKQVEDILDQLDNLFDVLYVKVIGPAGIMALDGAPDTKTALMKMKNQYRYGIEDILSQSPAGYSLIHLNNIVPILAPVVNQTPYPEIKTQYEKIVKSILDLHRDAVEEQNEYVYTIVENYLDYAKSLI